MEAWVWSRNRLENSGGIGEDSTERKSGKRGRRNGEVGRRRCRTTGMRFTRRVKYGDEIESWRTLEEDRAGLSIGEDLARTGRGGRWRADGRGSSGNGGRGA